MNNKYGCGCGNGRQAGSGCQMGSGCQAGSAFMPVNSNWDFNMDGCQQGCGGRQRQNRCGACEAAENTCKRNRQAECAERSACQKQACTGCADCTCESCQRRREADCNACGSTYTNREKNACTGRADCTCERCQRRREADCNACSKKNKADNRGVGIVWAWNQQLDDVYDCGRALKAGTLYPELHKPMDGYHPCGESCGDRCQQIAFAMWELRLYLNTHPCDQEALALLHRLQENCCEPNYATTFLEDVPCTDGTRNPAWRWGSDPWPWEYEANCGC